MTVKDLIEKLSKMPQSATIIVDYHSDWHADDIEPEAVVGYRHVGGGNLVTVDTDWRYEDDASKYPVEDFVTI